MARFNADTADNFGGSKGNWFSLKNDGDTANVKFMYSGMDDVEGYSVHELKFADNRRVLVNCLRDYNSPIDDCPLCKAGYQIKPKVFVPLYDNDTEEVKIWERGKNFFKKISSISARYKPLVAHNFDIERHGAKGDMKTEYEFFETGEDGKTLEDLPEVPQILGTIVKDKTADEMEYFLDHGDFPGEGNSTQRENTRGGNANDGVRGRRTPSRRETF